jgi:hypothetical protein
MGVSFRLAEPEDIGSIVGRGIRLVDRIEADAMGRGDDIEAAISDGLGEAPCYVMCDEQGPFAIGGITNHGDNPSVGIPWFVSTDDLTRHRFSFSRVVRKLMTEADRKYEKMEQRMWVENYDARAFAESVGFEFDDEDLCDMRGLDFVYFSRKNPGRA